MGRALNSVTGIIAEKASTCYTDITTIPVSIPDSLTSLCEVPRLQKNKQMYWNGKLEWEAGKGGAVKLSVARSHCGVCICSLLVLVDVLKNT